MRQPKPWYRTSKSAWFVEFDGQQVRLAKGGEDATEKAAYEAYFKLIARGPEGVPAADKLLTALLCDVFLEHSL